MPNAWILSGTPQGVSATSSRFLASVTLLMLFLHIAPRATACIQRRDWGGASPTGNPRHCRSPSESRRRLYRLSSPRAPSARFCPAMELPICRDYPSSRSIPTRSTSSTAATVNDSPVLASTAFKTHRDVPSVFRVLVSPMWNPAARMVSRTAYVT